jgi:transposase-like protein
MTDQRHLSPAAFKRDAVRLVTEQGDGGAEAARHLGLKASQLGRWTRAVEESVNGAVPGQGRVSLEPEERCRLRAENWRWRPC